MEFKVIIYIVVGIIYFIYTFVKKKEEEMPATGTGKQKPVTPPAYNPLEEVMKEIQRKQAAEQAKKTIQQKPKPAPKPQPVKTTGRDVLLHEKKVAAFQEGVGSMESVYERELTDEEKIERGNLKIENEGVYKVESMEELEAREKKQEASTFQFDARNAIISSIVLERKF